MKKDFLYIIVTVALAFFISSTVLGFFADRALDENIAKNWWAVYFNDPKSVNLKFVIENHSDNHAFSWEILEGKKTIKSEKIHLEKGSSAEIDPDLDTEFKDMKISVVVKTGEDKKEIYKNL